MAMASPGLSGQAGLDTVVLDDLLVLIGLQKIGSCSMNNLGHRLGSAAQTSSLHNVPTSAVD
jgi:hypothetical protein